MTFKNPEFICTFFIHKGKMEYAASDFSERFNQFKAENTGKRGEVVFKIDDESVEHFQHKWYRGFLVPPIARESFDNDRFQTHIELKKIFLIREVSKYSEIPDKQRAGCIPLYREYIDQETGEIKSQIYAYLPSTKNLTFDEMREYIVKVEKFMAEYIQAGFNNNDLRERDKAFGINPDQVEKFNETQGVG